jgi:hypothetical protein
MGTLSEQLPTMMGLDLLKSRFNPTGCVIHICEGIKADDHS